MSAFAPGLARNSCAASTIVVSQFTDRVFVLQGTKVEKAAAMDLIITYDGAAAPSVAYGGLISGALTAVNTNTPGTLRMGIIRIAPIEGSGIIAALTFDKAVKITALNASLSTLDGGPISAQVQVENTAGTNTTDIGASAAEPQVNTVSGGAARSFAYANGMKSSAPPSDGPSADQAGDSNTENITDNAGPNRVPSPTGDLYTVEASVPLTVASPGVLANDTDPDGNTLTAVLVNGPSDPNASVKLSPDGSFTYMYKAKIESPIVDAFTYRVNDGSMDSLAATILIMVNPRSDHAPPAATVPVKDK